MGVPQEQGQARMYVQMQGGGVGSYEIMGLIAVADIHSSKVQPKVL